MTKPIVQSVKLAAPAGELFRAFLDSKLHSKITGSPAKVSSKVGARFTAFDGMLSGLNLLIVRDRLIVQVWRSCSFKAGDADSILVLGFSDRPGGVGRIDLCHVNVPEHDHQGVTRGWTKYYWKPWKKYLSARGRRK